ncbi:winged helix-turn-helix transcriptional regulator [Halobaculum litoreum]|uniref:Winged helix-turn-helix transcriptional regulator n=1 Tax=Halobaculum litoreum TaxID=3031998 RepID=A0ABD5XX39_9EURY
MDQRLRTDGGADSDTTTADPADDGSAASSDADEASETPPATCPTGADGNHPASDLLGLLGRAHAIRTLYTIVHGAREDGSRGGPWRFSRLESTLDISPNTLSARLDEFEAAGLVVRTQYEEIPPRVEYEATDKARALDGVFREPDVDARARRRGRRRRLVGDRSARPRVRG